MSAKKPAKEIVENQPEPPAGLERCIARTSTSLTFLTAPSFEECQQIFETQKGLRNSTAFWIGDVINHMEDHFGERFAQIFDHDDRNNHTLINYASVCRRIEKSRRRDLLTYSMHEAIAYLPPQEGDRLMREAELKRWSRDDLRDAVARLQGKPTAAEKTAAKEAKKTGGVKKLPPAKEPATLDIEATVTKGGDEPCAIEKTNAPAEPSGQTTNAPATDATESPIASNAAQESNPPVAASPTPAPAAPPQPEKKESAPETPLGIDNDYDKDIHTNPDARAWARFFMETKANTPAISDDEECMLGWFANAMMAMHDHLEGKRQREAAKEPKITPQDPRSDTPEYFLACFVNSIPRIDVKNLSPLAKKTWLKKLIPVDVLIDDLGK